MKFCLKMLENYLRKLKGKFSKFAKDNQVFDIILYGSASKGSIDPKDLDILLIFEKGSLKDRLVVVQDFKKIFSGVDVILDVKTILLVELFDKNFLARQGVLVDGWSLLNDLSFAQRFGFKGHVIFSYSLKGLSHNDKTKFNYVLSGRGKGVSGLLNKVEGSSLGKGAVIVLAKNSVIFEEFLNRWNVKYKKKEVLVND